MREWLEEAGLDVIGHQDIAPPQSGGAQLTVSVFVAKDPRILMV